MAKLKLFIQVHKVWSLLIVLAVAVGGYFGYQRLFPATTPVQYVTEAAAKTTVSLSVSGTGQVSEANSVELKPQGSGAITTLNVKQGDSVKAGDIVAVIDQRSTGNAIRQAQAGLASAQASYQALVGGATAIDIKLQQDSISQAQTSYQNALTSQTNTKQSTALSVTQAQKTLNDLLNTANPTGKRGSTLTEIGSDISTARSALDNANKILTDPNGKDSLSSANPILLAQAQTDYNRALPLLTTANNAYMTATANATDDNLDTAVNGDIKLNGSVSTALNDLFQVLQNTAANAKFTQSTVDGYKSTVTSQQTSVTTNVSAIQTAIQDLKDAITTAQNDLTTSQQNATQSLANAQATVDSANHSLAQAKDNLTKLTEPPTTANLAAARASVLSAQTQLTNAGNDYDNNIIKAPFAGVIAQLDQQKGDQASSGTVLATLITKEQLAVIPLNEVDVAKIKTNQDVTLTFDALPDFSLAGKVGEIDTIGTVTQGVVNYNVKIGFDTQDTRIKPGMSVNATIITQVHADVLAVPNGAVKSNGSGSYVQTLDANNQPQQVSVQVGLANDTMTEITSGLNEGDQVITQTIVGKAASATTAKSGISIPGLTGGAVRTGGGNAAFRAGGGG